MRPFRSRNTSAGCQSVSCVSKKLSEKWGLHGETGECMSVVESVLRASSLY